MTGINDSAILTERISISPQMQNYSAFGNILHLKYNRVL